jgi:hypothetical protein
MSTLTATLVTTATTTVALSSVLTRVRVFIRRFVVLSSEQATALTLWAAHTHAIDAAECTPYLHATSATKRAGKTRLLETMEPIVARPWFTGRTSAAALVRKIDAITPSLLFDEADATFAGEKEFAETFRGILNTGYRRSGKATVCTGKGTFVVQDFRTFCPKLIAGIGRLPDTVADRSIPIALRRRTRDERCERWRARDGRLEGAPLHDALAAVMAPLLERLTDARPALPPELSDRQADVWEPLLAIAEAAGGEWPTLAATAATALSASAEDDDIAVDLLADIRDFMKENPAGEWIRTAALLEHLVALEDRAWATWRKGEKPLTSHGLRRLLKPFGIHPDRFTDAGVQARGYRRDALADAGARYLPIEVSTRLSPNNHGPKPAKPTCLNGLPLDTAENAETPITTGAKTHRHFDRGDTAPHGFEFDGDAFGREDD